ncbi:YicC/YloC family endoribonuclease [Lichenibacterium dinghuense]|uniref:YicC/YloC family endoribonuclease n=1 Tax=Lichenibacterium dinghuense TaxID=2895977 RepID=UPI001F390993|nr:YicC/YloC family endoribonuclease [Lichenibacterium sp. 6Y81]
MTLSSMTGFARSGGQAGSATWAWEVKSVNAKGLELRIRVPPGFDALEAAARTRLAARLKRGTVHAALNLQRPKPRQTARIDRDRLDALIAAVSEIVPSPRVAPATLDGLLALPGVVEIVEVAEPGTDLDPALLEGLDAALEALCAMRSAEGAELRRVLGERLSAVSALTARAQAAPGRTPEAVRARLAARVAEIAAAADTLDPVRLHQEAVLMAAKADVREELDRLAMHAAAASALLDEGGAVGRRLDFLAQELGREAGTLCAKSGDAELTAAGLALRTEIEQFREQVQNLE